MRILQGDTKPRAEQEHWYVLNNLVPQYNQSPFSTKKEEKLVWTLYKSVNGQWKKVENNIKYGEKNTYQFGQKVVGIPFKIVVHSQGKNMLQVTENKLISELVITPKTAKEPVIGRVILLNKNKKDVNKATFHEFLTAQARTSNLLGKTITFYMWEEGANEFQKYLKPKTDVVDKNGIAKVEFNLSEYATPQTWMNFMQLNSGATKKFYVTAVYEDKKETNKTPVTASNGQTRLPQSTQQPQHPAQAPTNQGQGTIAKGIEILAEGLGSLFRASTDTGVSATKVDPPQQKKEKKEENTVKIIGTCYCHNQGIVETPCNGKGSLVTDKHFESLAKDIGVEAKVFKAVAIVESGGRKSFLNVDGKQKAKILYERHYMYRFLKKLKTQQQLDDLKKNQPDLVHNVGTYKDKNAKYGSEEEQFGKLEKAKKIDNDSAIKSCSWGKFQVMGKYYNYLYGTPDEMEDAMNMCEVQHFAYFKVYLKDVTGAPMIKAMKDKNWNKIAELYNGPDYPINKYHTKMKSQYEKL